MEKAPDPHALINRIEVLKSEIEILKKQLPSPGPDPENPLLPAIHPNIYRRILEHAPVIIDCFDDQGNCLLWNRKGEELLGYTEKEIMQAKDPLRLVYPDDALRELVYSDIHNADGRPREYAVTAKDGSIRIQEWANFKLGNDINIAFGIDVTEQRRTEKTLKESDARLRAFTEAIPDILFIYDEDGRYVEIFTSASDLLYDDLQKLKGDTIANALPAPVAALHDDIIQKTLDTGKSQEFEYTLDVPRGTCYFESRTAPILGLEGKKRLIASSVRDVTERKLAEKEVLEKEKLAGVMETTGAVCHELNQPLQIITGTCELLKMTDGLDDAVEKKINTIVQASERMAKLNHKLMNITSYKTKSYLKSQIIDIDEASESRQ